MNDKNYQKQVQAHIKSLELGLKGVEVDIKYHAEKLKIAKEEKKRGLSALKLAKCQLD